MVNTVSTLLYLVNSHHTSTNKNSEVVDVAICWNYLVVGDKEGITKYGLVNNKPCLER